MPLFLPHFNLQKLNTLAVPAVADYFVAVHNDDELREALAFTRTENCLLLLLGGGSNIVLRDDFPGVVIQLKSQGKEVVAETDDHVWLKVAAGENWHQLVQSTVAEGWWGLENLALIPGSVGAAPVQNIGAYGVELADCCIYVDFFHWQSQKVERLSREQCLFGYRDSLFKTALAGKGIIVAVGLQLQRYSQPHLSYKGLDHLPVDCTPSDVMAAVIAVRQSKLPDPAILANCGSFFKNPVVNHTVFDAIQHSYPAMPFYPQADGLVKLAAGWLIEQVGLKGQRIGDVGCYEKQALVLVNFGEGTAADLQQMIALIQQKVVTQFAVQLEPEVRLLGQ